MKDKNLPNDYNSLSLEELTTEANKIIEELENQKDLRNSLDKYQNLIESCFDTLINVKHAAAIDRIAEGFTILCSGTRKLKNSRFKDLHKTYLNPVSYKHLRAHETG